MSAQVHAHVPGDGMNCTAAVCHTRPLLLDEQKHVGGVSKEQLFCKMQR
jgi:hypothetical protein